MIDLHTHTNHSDGTLDPSALVRQAKALGLEALAIADHDTLSGYDQACAEAAACSFELVCAVELSTRIERPADSSRRNASAHLLGYFPNRAPGEGFRNWLQEQSARRERRNRDLVAKLNAQGVEISLEEVTAEGRNQIGRQHFARVLVAKGYVRSFQEAFDVYLGDHARAAVPREEARIEDAIAQIRAAGGFASLAHPVRLPESKGGLRPLVSCLVEAGLQGIEVIHSDHSAQDVACFCGLASEFHLVETGGSDFHGDNKPRVKLGSGVSGNVQVPYEVLERIKDRCSPA